ncbi:hypothetical protein [Halorubrum aquaticum]|uniref:hypothetical protein n=1 Tax=Halorubrum aquaticum TaxID=387340 RepID=UPI001CB6BE29|nr:hypothetical protein [Halorubrum aquaticum]
MTVEESKSFDQGILDRRKKPDVLRIRTIDSKSADRVSTSIERTGKRWPPRPDRFESAGSSEIDIGGELIVSVQFFGNVSEMGNGLDQVRICRRAGSTAERT